MHTRRKNIGLFMAMLENEFSQAILKGAANAAKEENANLIVFPMGLIDGAYSDKIVNNFRYQYNVLNSFLQCNSLDGIAIEYGTIVSSVDDAKKEEFLSLIGDIPVVLLNEKVDGYPCICVNNKIGLEEVLQHLISKHKATKIGFISGPKYNHDAIERLSVYRSVMEANRINTDNTWIEYGDFSIYSGDAVRKLISRHPEIEAIVFANDHMALGAYPVLEALGYKIGKDIIVTGFDNIPTSILQDPPITTVMPDTVQMAYQAVKSLIGSEPLEDAKYINSKMILRESCGCSLHKSLFKGIFDKYSESDDSIEEHGGSAENVRRATRDKVKENEKRKEFEVELGNINREMVFFQETEVEWFSSVISMLRKLEFDSSYLFLYDDYIPHKNHTPWIQPKTANLRGYYASDINHVFDEGQFVCNLDTIFDQRFITKNHRYDMVVTPLFFRENHYGLMMVETEPAFFQFAFHIASQISSTLEIMNILNAQERIKQELAYANESKSQFIANVSHEIRTPINAILGMNEMILRENSDSTIDKYAMDVKQAAHTLLHIVNDILDVSKIEAGKMTIVPAEYNLANLLGNTIKLMSTRAKNSGLELELEYDETLPSVLYGDDVRIQQILMNLLSNAIKYTNEGSVRLKVSGAAHSDKDTASLTFEVIDTGIGIKPEDLQKLFEKFERIEEKRNRNIEGTGLGMNITLGLLNLMGSTLSVNSVYNEGSNFSFVLKQRIVDSTPIGKQSANEDISVKEKYSQKFTAPGKKILVVDDVDINRVIVCNFLKESQIEIDEASDGNECINMVKGKHYDLILLDHMMPGLDGVDTLKELNKLDCFDQSKTVVIALTANAAEGSADAYKRLGFDNYLSKPVEPDLLDELIIKYLL